MLCIFWVFGLSRPPACLKTIHGVCVCVCVCARARVCVCVNYPCAKVSFFCLSINQGSLHLQGAEAPIQTPLLTKLVCMW